jgi:predicted nuclease of predicted toxin-antitoxin system
MSLWLDEHLSPQLADWIARTLGFEAIPIRDLGLARASDREVFNAAGRADAIILTKDADFVGILEKVGPPPRVIWLTCGNTSNANLRRLLQLEALESGEPMVEIR